MSSNYSYRNLQNGQSINSNNIVNDDADGIVEILPNGAYRYVPASSLGKETIVSTQGYELENSPTIVGKLHNEDSFLDENLPDGQDVLLKNKVSYCFGIDSVSIQDKTPKSVAGFVSGEIQIGSCSRIELVSNASKNIEFSIIDGGIEAPILPAGIDHVDNERLFFGLAPRFSVDQTKPVVIKKNGSVTQLSFGDLDSIQHGSDIYTMDYTAVDANKYSPTNTTIKVKVIQRNFDGEVPEEIRSILIQKYGGAKTWNM